MLNNLFSKNRTVYEIMSKNVVEPERSQKTIQYGDARFMLDKQGYCAYTRSRDRAHTRTHT
jgi:hypothetical protein